jgi:hypothetical protein
MPVESIRTSLTYDAAVALSRSEKSGKRRPSRFTDAASPVGRADRSTLSLGVRDKGSRAGPITVDVIVAVALHDVTAGCYPTGVRRTTKPARIICAMLRASSRSALLICAFNAARMCRVSTQITDNSASARALKSHCRPRWKFSQWTEYHFTKKPRQPN